MGNTIFFEGIDSIRYFNWLADRNWDTPLVAPFLHEFTHRWCFASLLGDTLAFGELRTFAMSGRLPEYRSFCAQEYLGRGIISGLLRPIAEGLALFSEYDLAPDDGDLKLGTPLTASDVCFVNGSGHLFSRFALMKIRRDPEFIDRKASLYLHDFEVQEGYLPGYLFVKWLFALMKIRVPKLSEEKFLAYVRCYFWEDPVTVNLMHAFHLPTQDYVNGLVSHFLHRVDQLRLADDLSERLDEFWEAWSTKGIFQPGRGIFCEDQAAEEARNFASFTVGKSLELIAESPETADFVDKRRIAALGRVLSNFRRFTVVARAPVEIRHEADRAVFAFSLGDGAEQLLQYPTVGPIPEGRYEFFAVVPNFSEYLVLLLRDRDRGVHSKLGRPVRSALAWR